MMHKSRQCMYSSYHAGPTSYDLRACRWSDTSLGGLKERQALGSLHGGRTATSFRYLTHQLRSSSFSGNHKALCKRCAKHTVRNTYFM